MASQNSGANDFGEGVARLARSEGPKFARQLSFGLLLTLFALLGAWGAFRVFGPYSAFEQTATCYNPKDAEQDSRANANQYACVIVAGLENDVRFVAPFFGGGSETTLKRDAQLELRSLLSNIALEKIGPDNPALIIKLVTWPNVAFRIVNRDEDREAQTRNLIFEARKRRADLIVAGAVNTSEGIATSLDLIFADPNQDWKVAAQTKRVEIINGKVNEAELEAAFRSAVRASFGTPRLPIERVARQCYFLFWACMQYAVTPVNPDAKVAALEAPSASVSAALAPTHAAGAAFFPTARFNPVTFDVSEYLPVASDSKARTANVTVRCQIGADGMVGVCQARDVSSPASGLADAAIAIVRRAGGQPALRNGAAIPDGWAELTMLLTTRQPRSARKPIAPQVETALPLPTEAQPQPIGGTDGPSPEGALTATKKSDE